jgi:hypothetical protein
MAEITPGAVDQNCLIVAQSSKAGSLRFPDHANPAYPHLQEIGAYALINRSFLPIFEGNSHGSASSICRID